MLGAVGDGLHKCKPWRGLRIAPETIPSNVEYHFRAKNMVGYQPGEVGAAVNTRLNGNSPAAVRNFYRWKGDTL